jgi:hypothetical protein
MVTPTTSEKIIAFRQQADSIVGMCRSSVNVMSTGNVTAMQLRDVTNFIIANRSIGTTAMADPLVVARLPEETTVDLPTLGAAIGTVGALMDDAMDEIANLFGGDAWVTLNLQRNAGGKVSQVVDSVFASWATAALQAKLTAMADAIDALD